MTKLDKKNMMINYFNWKKESFVTSKNTSENAKRISINPVDENEVIYKAIHKDIVCNMWEKLVKILYSKRRKN